MIHLTVTTVEREALDLNQVTRVSIPTTEGVITVLPNHVPLMSSLGMGELVVHYAGPVGQHGPSPVHMFIDGGVVQFQRNKLEVLTHLAENAEELDEAKIAEAKRKAERLLAERPVDIDLAKIEASLQRELMRLKLVKKKKSL